VHNFTAKEVLKSDFDLSLLRVSDQDLEELSLRYEEERKIQQAELSKRNLSYKCHYSSVFHSIFTEQFFSKNESFFLSLIFDEKIIQRLNFITEDQVSGYFDHYAITLSKKYRGLGDKIVLFSKINSFKSSLLWKGLVSQSVIESLIKNRVILNVHPFYQEKVIALYGSEEAKYFLTSESDFVRLAAYNKIGPIKCIDAMLADPSAKVRLRAVQVMDPDDERISGLINDSSKKVFGEVLKKIENEKLPLLIGNKHLKDKYFKRYFEERFLEAKN